MTNNSNLDDDIDRLPDDEAKDIILFDEAEPWGGDAALLELQYVDGKIVGAIPLDRVLDQHDPFNSSPWIDGQNVSYEGVKLAIAESRFEAQRYPSYLAHKEPWDDKRHEERIAFLVCNPSDDPISIEFPHPDGDGFRVEDGNHRIAAAIFRGDAEINIEVGGFFRQCASALGVICREFHEVAPKQAFPVV